MGAYLAPRILGCSYAGRPQPLAAYDHPSSRRIIRRSQRFSHPEQGHRPALLLVPRLRLTALHATTLSASESSDGRKQPARLPLPDLPALPAVLLLLGNAVLTKDALLLASFFGLQAALPIPKLRKLGLSAYNALAASVTLVFLAWATIVRVLPAQHLQVMNVESYLTIPLPKLLVYHSTKLASSAGFSRTACSKLLTSSAILPAALLLSFLALNVLVLQVVKRKEPAIINSRAQSWTSLPELQLPQDVTTDASTALSTGLVSEGSAKQSTEGGDEAEEPATRAQELAGSESDTSFVKPIRSPKIAGVQSLESMYKDHLARKELKKAFLPTEGAQPSYKELLERLKALEGKQAHKSGMAAKVRDEQMKTAVAGLRLEVAELKERRKVEAANNELRHKQYTAALKELQPAVAGLKEQGLLFTDKIRDIEQQSSQLLIQAKNGENESAISEQLQNLRADAEAADQELHKSQERASRVLEDVISHIHSPSFSQQVTAGFAETLEALQQEVQELKTRSEVSQLQQMEGVKVQKVVSMTETGTETKSPTPLQAAPAEVLEALKDAVEIDVASKQAEPGAEDAFDVAVEEIGDED